MIFNKTLSHCFYSLLVYNLIQDILDIPDLAPQLYHIHYLPAGSSVKKRQKNDNRNVLSKNACGSREEEEKATEKNEKLGIFLGIILRMF